jgi:hypothetical protein
MKKIASILTLFVGLILFALNYHVTTYSGQSSSTGFHKKSKPIEKTESEDKSFDVSNINLPSIFDVLIRSLK